MSPLLAGLALDLVLGDPAGWPHPVRWIGWVISKGQSFILARRFSPGAESLTGLALWVIIVAGVWAAAFGLLAGLAALWPPLAWIVGAIMAWTCLSLKDLTKHARSVLDFLVQGDLTSARRAIGLIVGRQTASLDQTGVARAGLETLAESLCDGVIAPLFYLLLGGPALGLAYKAVNTLDSMLGYRYPPFTHLGRWPARLDDLANFVPARLTFLFLVAAAALARENPRQAWRVGLAEHGRSASPNAGWPEAAMAGALDVSLLGPAVYFGHRQEKPFINQTGRPPGPAELKRGLNLIWLAGLLAYLLAALITAA